jgi:hypothetical protein
LKQFLVISVLNENIFVLFFYSQEKQELREREKKEREDKSRDKSLEREILRRHHIERQKSLLIKNSEC